MVRGSRIPHGWRWVVLSIQRTIVQGPFLREEAERLKSLLKPLAEAAILARNLGFARVAGLGDALELIGQPCIVFDGSGCVLTINALAEGLVGLLIDVKTRTLAFGDPRSQRALTLFSRPRPMARRRRRRPTWLPCVTAMARATSFASSRYAAGHAIPSRAPARWCCSTRRNRPARPRRRFFARPSA